MFTSSRLAPPRTCSSATSTAPPKSPASTSRRKRAEPVTFVRSPIITKPVSGPISNGSSPLKRGAGRLSGTCRGDSPLVTSTMALTCSGVVPQQPPTMLRSPSRANSRSEEHTSEFPSRENLVCRLLLEKKKQLHLLSPFRQPIPLDTNRDHLIDTL